MERAKKVIMNPTVLTPVEHEITRGPRKGTETRWNSETTNP